MEGLALHLSWYAACPVGASRRLRESATAQYAVCESAPDSPSVSVLADHRGISGTGTQDAPLNPGSRVTDVPLAPAGDVSRRLVTGSATGKTPGHGGEVRLAGENETAYANA